MIFKAFFVPISFSLNVFLYLSVVIFMLHAFLCIVLRGMSFIVSLEGKVLSERAE